MKQSAHFRNREQISWKIIKAHDLSGDIYGSCSFCRDRPSDARTRRGGARATYALTFSHTLVYARSKRNRRNRACSACASKHAATAASSCSSSVKWYIYNIARGVGYVSSTKSVDVSSARERARAAILSELGSTGPPPTGTCSAANRLLVDYCRQRAIHRERPAISRSNDYCNEPRWKNS
ncbi:unnamed protein product [Trichogramma brassicae]|uniref:Uncharacterized protein n=1 Tax=Trichogramma brassicae TaxID=86971 RepID=A0A6H5IQR3_9HYME|nr:unnamed protein product [Trichogramma brassicae]